MRSPTRHYCLFSTILINVALWEEFGVLELLQAMNMSLVKRSCVLNVCWGGYLEPQPPHITVEEKQQKLHSWVGHRTPCI